MFFKNAGPSLPEVSHKRIEAPDKDIYFNHIHNHCEILFFKSVDAEYNIDGQTFKPSPFDLLFVPAATYHYLIPSSNVPYENYVIGIDPAAVRKSHYQKLFSEPLMINIKDDSIIEGFFQRLDLYDRDYNQEDFCESCASLVNELVIYLSCHKDKLNSVHSRSNDIVEKIIEYINNNIENDINADTISRHFLLSKSYVQNLFSEHMHIGLKKYINQKKVYAAYNDLKNGNSAYTVCDKYGFGDYSSFFRVFKQTFGVSPANI